MRRPTTEKLKSSRDRLAQAAGSVRRADVEELCAAARDYIAKVDGELDCLQSDLDWEKNH